MRVDASLSKYHEAKGAVVEFSEDELRNARFLLRRLRFLEAKIRDNAEVHDAVFVELEMTSLAWALDQIGYLFTEPE